MVTGNAPEHIRHVYQRTGALKSYSVFQLYEVTNNKNLLTDVLRIEEFQNKSKSTKIKDYLRLRTGTNWTKCELITGLRPTQNPNLFYGDWVKPNESDTLKRTLLMFWFSKDRGLMVIDFYRGFYPKNKGILQNIIKTYKANQKA